MKANTTNKIKFDNKTIEKIKVDDYEFSYVDKKGNSKFRRMIPIPFDVPKKSILKGLKLCVQRDIPE